MHAPLKRLLLLPLLLWTIAVPAALAAQPQRSDRMTLPFHFEKNLGQADPATRWLARVPGSALHVQGDGVLLDVERESERDVLRLHWLGARADAPVEADSLLASRSHYLVGNDATRFTRDVPHAARLVQRGVWSGVDVVYRDGGNGVEYDFAIAAGADPGAIRVGVEGASAVRVDADGRLVARVGTLDVVQPPPRVFQTSGDGARAIDGRWELAAANEVRFALAKVDAGAPLVIDPIVEWSSYAGGTGADVLHGVAVDTTGHAYVVGITTSLGLPSSPGAFQPAFAGGPRDSFVAKFAADGKSLVWLTYLGGNSNDVVEGVAVDAQNRVVVAGSTASSNFPVLNAAQPLPNAFPEAFVTKLDASGSALLFSTYLGGPGAEVAWGVASDPAGNTVIAGESNAAGYPLLHALQSHSGGIDAVVTRLDATGALVYSTYLGGTGEELGRSVAVDSAGQAYVTGETASSDFPVVNALQPTRPGGSHDAFVTKLGTTGSIVYSTYLGGSFADYGMAVGTDPSANTYVTGYSGSVDFPTTPGVLQPTLAGVYDAFVTKIDPTGSALLYSTFLGGSAAENYSAVGQFRRGGITGDRAGAAYVTGSTASSNFPVTANAFQPTFGGAFDAFVTKIAPGGGFLVWSSYLGGGGAEAGRGLAVDIGNSVYVVGDTSSANFPTTPLSAQPAYTSNTDGFITKIAIAPGTFSCATRTDKNVYADGEQITATALRFASSATVSESVQMKLSITSPSGSATIFDFGGGTLFLAAAANINLGPVPMFVVSPSLARGSYSLDCTISDPATGKVHARSSAPFALR